MLGMLRAVVTSGTGKGAGHPGFTADKTFTSQDNRVARFVGFSETLVIEVWVGNDDAVPIDGVIGSGLPVSIWRTVMAASQQIGLADTTLPSIVETSAAGVKCNNRACARSHRSFWASDCTYQSYRGRRQICTR